MEVMMIEINKDYFCWFDVSMMKIQSKKPAPVIITVPHDPVSHWSDWEGFLMPRKKGVFGRDKNIWPIIRDMVLKTKKISVVRSFFPRELIDCNRSLDDVISPATTDNQGLQQIYSNYHNAIKNFIESALKVYEIDDCLLLDVHGFIVQPFANEYYDIILGTAHRKTIRSGSDIDNILASFLRHCGYKVYVPTENEVPNEKYCGAFTIQHYNSECKINAIQIEIADKFRTEEGKKMGIKLSRDLAGFIESSFY